MPVHQDSVSGEGEKIIELVLKPEGTLQYALAQQAEREDDAEREQHHDSTPVIADQQLGCRGRQPPQSALAHICQ